MKVLWFIILGVCSYLFGNINFAKIISHCKQDDITKHGSGNPGTLNMLRTFGFKWAIFNMILEICKGLIPTLVGKLWLGEVGAYVAGVCVIVGHIFPVLCKFKGGKGVASFAGFSAIVLPWWVFLIIFTVCFTFVVITSIGSIGTLGFVLISTIVQLCLISPYNYGWVSYILLVAVVSLIMFVHRGNIKRLLQGKENPTNIKSAFKKDFHIKDKDEFAEILTEEDTKVSTLSTQTSNNAKPAKVESHSTEADKSNSQDVHAGDAK